LSPTELIAQLCKHKNFLLVLATAVAWIILCAISTGRVERSFSSMNRVATKLRNRLLSGNINYLVLVLTKGQTKISKGSAKDCEFVACIEAR